MFTLQPMVSPPTVPSGQCALPVFWHSTTVQGEVDTAFLVYPTGTLVGPSQKLGNAASATYDAAVGRWLPVGPEAVSPDGSQFAYADYDLPPNPAAGMAGNGAPRSAGALATTGRVHVMDARTGVDRILFSGSPTYSVVGFTTDGIYLARVAITMDGEFSSGLFLLPLAGSPIAAVPGGDRGLDRGGWTIVAGAAWGTEYSAGLGGLPLGNELVKLDLHTGIVTVWLTKAEGTSVWMDGFDSAGNPLVTATPSGYSSTGSPSPTPPMQLLALIKPQAATVLWQSTDPNAQPPFGPVVDDGLGAWLGEQNAIWLDTGGKLTMTPVAGSEALSPGAPCQ